MNVGGEKKKKKNSFHLEEEKKLKIKIYQGLLLNLFMNLIFIFYFRLLVENY